ncbi:MAG: SgcJ/EcaC family oxidoreductase, partial [Acidobacteriota bacterium]
SFLKGVTTSIDDMSVRVAGPDSAVVTVKNTMGTYTTPDGIKHENERQIKTFVVVKKDGKWLIMQDQNTIIGAK